MNAPPRFRRIRLALHIIGALAVALPPLLAQAEEVSLPPQGAYISSAPAEVDSNFSSGTERYYLPLRRVPGVDGLPIHRFALLKWNDLSGQVDAGRIESARLQLTAVTQAHEKPGERRVALYRLKREWDPRSVTWNDAGEGTPWEIPGAAGDADLGEKIGEASCYPDGDEPITLEFQLAPELIRSWLEEPDLNYGVLLKFIGEERDLSLTLYSSIRPESEKHLAPKLVIELKP